jgi:branched-chain amino acid transport system permease protein
MLLGRESGVFKTSYQRDMALYPLPLARSTAWAMLLLFLLMPVLLPAQYLTWVSLAAIAVPGAIGLNLLTGYAGLISLGHAGFMAVGGYTTAILASRYSVPVVLAIPLGGLMAALYGVIVGLPSRRVKGIYLAIATIAAQFITEWLINHVEWIGGGAQASVVVQRPAVGPIEVVSTTGRYYFVLAFAVLAFVIGLNIARSRVGRAFIAIRDHDIAAEVIGVDVFRYKLLAFAVSSFFAGITGAVWAAYLGIANYEMFTLTVSIEYLAMIAIGGLGMILGSVFGAVFVTILPLLVQDLLTRFKGSIPVDDVPAFTSQLRLALFGALIMLFMVIEPEGLYRMWRATKNYFRFWPFKY